VPVGRRQIEMLFDPPDAGLEIADDRPVPNHRRVVFDNGAAQADDLLAELLARLEQVCRDVGAQRVHVCGDVGAQRLDIRFQFSFHLGRVGSHIAKDLKDEAFWLLAHVEPLID
jgi:hypothetical protein